MLVCALMNKPISCSRRTDVLWLCNHGKEALIYNALFTPAPRHLVIYLSGSDFYDCVGGESQWSTWVEVLDNIITLFYCTPELWARQEELRLHFSFNNISFTRLLTFRGRTDSRQEHFFIWYFPSDIHTLNVSLNNNLNVLDCGT